MESKYPYTFKQPRSALRKSMAWRAKYSHLGAFQTLPEHVLLSCLARLPRDDHDAVADCSTGFRAVMRSERFLKARRAEEITEEALVVVGDCFMALVSGRMWRRLVPMSAEMRISGGFAAVARAGTAVIGSEIFMAGGMKQDSTYAGVSVFDAVDEEWFPIPLSSSAYPQGMPRELFAVGCAGRLYVGGMSSYDPHSGRILIQRWDPDAQRWVELPPMPPQLLPRGDSRLSYQLVAVAVGTEIYVLDRLEPIGFRVFDTDTETWSVVDIPEEVAIVDLRDWTGPYNYRVPWAGICVDRTLIHLSDYTAADGEPPRIREHYAYDTVNDRWISFEGGMPRHTAYSESDRILSVVNYDGPNDYIFDTPRQSRGGVHAFERRGEHDCMITGAVDLPVRYDAVERAIYVAMP